MLTAIQRKYLMKCVAYRDQPYTSFKILVAMLPMMIVLGVLVVISYVLVSLGLALFMGGMSLGAILRQGSLSWQSSRIMPALVQVIDWDRVDQLLQESNPV